MAYHDRKTGIITESKSNTESEEVRCSLRSLLILSYQLTTYYLLFLHEQKSKERPRHPLISRKLSANNTEPLQAVSTTVHMCDWALDRSNTLSMTCQATRSSSFWSEVLGPSPDPNCVLPTTSTLLCLWYPASPYAAFRAHSQRPSPLTLPCQLSPLHLRDYWLNFITGIHTGLMPAWALGLPSAMQDAQGRHSECLLNEGSIGFIAYQCYVCEAEEGQN